MSTLETETDIDNTVIDNTVRATEAVAISDCGRVSACTQGFPALILFELASPPNNKAFLF
jgi:hypothetical protein